MIMTFDKEMAVLITALKDAKWDAMHKIAVQQNPSGTREFVLLASGKLFTCLQQVEYITFDYWTIADLINEMLVAEAAGFHTAQPNSRQRYRLAVLEAIRKHTEDPANVVWTSYTTVE